jgi:hypothetical protein
VGDETWIHHFEPEFKWQSVKYNILKEDEIQEFAVSWQNLGHILQVEEVVVLNFLPSA